MKGINRFEEGAKSSEWGYWIMPFFEKGPLDRFFPSYKRGIKLISEIEKHQV